MRAHRAAISCATLIAALPLAGCGSSSSALQPGVAVHFQSADVPAGRAIPARYTCDGKNVAPSFEWGAVPSNTGELVLLVVGLKPSAIANKFSVSIEWALAGINPQIHKLAAGQVPPGAHVGLASSGRRAYSICPKKGVLEAYQFALYAVRSSISLSPKFTGMSALAALSPPNTSTSAIAHGAFVADYKRA